MEGDMGRGRIERRSFDKADHSPFGHFFWSDIGPGFSTIASQLNQTIIGAGPEQAFLFWRFRETENHVVVFDGVLILCERAAGILLLVFVVEWEVLADGGPSAPCIVGTTYELR